MASPEKNTVRELPQTFNAAAADTTLLPATEKRYRAKVFKSGNSLALRLPKALGLEAGMELELTVVSDGTIALKRIEPPKRGIDISGFAGKAPWLKPLPREFKEFEQRPSTIAKRKAADLE